MTSPILSFTTQNQATYSRLSRQIDCDMILNRVKTSLDVSDPLYLQYNKTCREYQEKRDKRRERKVHNDERKHLEKSKKAENLSDEIDQWIRNIKSPQFELKYSRYVTFGSTDVLKAISKRKTSLER